MGERVLSFVVVSLIQENLEPDAERRGEGQVVRDERKLQYCTGFS